MARVAIDVHMFGEQWFGAVRQELVRSENVRFAYSQLNKATTELSRVREAAKFFKLMGDVKRRDDAHTETVARFHDQITSQVAWKRNHGRCDDGHVFALVRTLPTPFVFTLDVRMAQCRDCLSGKIDAAFLRFSIVKSPDNYNALRVLILR